MTWIKSDKKPDPCILVLLLCPPENGSDICTEKLGLWDDLTWRSQDGKIPNVLYWHKLPNHPRMHTKLPNKG